MIKERFSIKEASKILGLPYGNVTLFKKLRQLGIFTSENLPCIQHCGKGYFDVVNKENYLNGKSYSVTLLTIDGLKFLKSLLDQSKL